MNGTLSRLWEAYAIRYPNLFRWGSVGRGATKSKGSRRGGDAPGDEYGLCHLAAKMFHFPFRAGWTIPVTDSRSYLVRRGCRVWFMEPFPRHAYFTADTTLHDHRFVPRWTAPESAIQGCNEAETERFSFQDASLRIGNRASTVPTGRHSRKGCAQLTVLHTLRRSIEAFGGSVCPEQNLEIFS